MSAVPAATLAPAEADGRNLRRRRSFDRATDAVLDLIGEGNPSPTAQQIAARSGISIRTVFRLTDDVESLHAAAIGRQTERIAPLYVTLPDGGPFRTRVGALVENRAVIFETIAPVRRVAERLAVGSALIADGLERHRRLLRTQITRLFEPELSGLSTSDRRALLTALDVASSWETWDQLRRLRGLSRSESARVMRQLLQGLVTTYQSS